ncbi:MAG TPA: condensation domain-containing protein, partial [Vicinamibacteria bacterium]|nr:condensation domain-containing protein [Vicinamibacteria bacterium]
MAYVISASGGQADADALGTHLAARLPAAAVPSAFVVVPELPRTPSGKRDRIALSRLALPEPRRRDGLAAADGLVAEIWRSVLGLDQASAHDDFFATGGHSLLAVELAAQVSAATGIDVPVRTLFEAPTLAAFAARVLALREAGRPRFDLTRRAAETPAPLSIAQSRLWFLERLRPGVPFLTLSLAVRLTGALDVAALARAWDALLARHDALRTRLPWIDGRPVQILGTGAPLEVVDLGGEALRDRLAAEAARSFDLENGPLARAALFRVTDAEHVLSLSLHHAIADGASLGLLLRDLDALYGGTRALALLPFRHVDYVDWQGRRLEGEDARASLDAWRGRLSSVPALDVPTDRDRPVLPSGIAGALDLEVPADLRAALRVLAREAGASEAMALLAGWALVVARFTGQDDFALGVPVSGRNRPELAGIVGLFANILPVRVDLSGRPHFREVLARVRAAMLFAYAHADLPFETLIDALQPARDARRHPLVQAIFGVQDVPSRTDRFLGLPAALVPAPREVTRVDLEVQLFRSDEAVRGRLLYPVELFDAETIQRLGRDFTALLGQAVAEPRRPVSALSLDEETDAEVRLVGPSTPPARAEAPRHATLHALFEAQAARTPDAIAIEQGSSRWTYADLDRRANRLAGRLRGLGLGPDAIVGLWLPRSSDWLAAWLGILKAGAACLPLDPSHPVDRAERVLATAGATAVVTSTELEGRLSIVARRILVDDPQLAAESDMAAAVAVGPDDLAYVIATSGSEGVPKAV